MTAYEILRQHDAASSWRFDVEATDAEGTTRTLELTLSWADYNRWSPDGADRPSAVAEAVLAFLLARIGLAELPERLDASVTRRWFGEADGEIAGLIRRS